MFLIKAISTPARPENKSAVIEVTVVVSVSTVRKQNRKKNHPKGLVGKVIYRQIVPLTASSAFPDS